MNHHHTRPALDDEDGPTATELDAIAAEWPLIAAEIDVVDAEIRLLTAGPHGPSDLDWRRLRRAEHRVLRVAAQLADREHATRGREVA